MVQVYVSGKLPTYPSPKPTLTLTSHLGQNVGVGEEVGSFSETYPSPKNQHGSLYVSGKLPTYPSPKPTFFPK